MNSLTDENLIIYIWFDIEICHANKIVLWFCYQSSAVPNLAKDQFHSDNVYLPRCNLSSVIYSQFYHFVGTLYPISQQADHLVIIDLTTAFYSIDQTI